MDEPTASQNAEHPAPADATYSRALIDRALPSALDLIRVSCPNNTSPSLLALGHRAFILYRSVLFTNARGTVLGDLSKVM